MLSLRAISLIEPHIYSFNNLVMTGVENSVGVRVLTITEHKTFMCFRCKFRIVMRISNPTFCTEDFEITHIWLFVSEELISSFVEEFVKIYPVDDVACSINSIRPETRRCLVFIKRAISRRVLFLCSKTPFYLGV